MKDGKKLLIVTLVVAGVSSIAYVTNIFTCMKSIVERTRVITGRCYYDEHCKEEDSE